MAQVNKKNISLARAILAALWYGKILNIKSISQHPYIQLLSNNKKSATYRSTISRLIKGAILKKEDQSISLTDMGRREALFAFIEAESALYRPNFFQKWDKAWRILFFDIPESKRRYRDYLRNTLRKVGFKEMQRSIWAYPYPVPSFLGELLLQKEIKPHVRFITTDSIDSDVDLRKMFNLT